MDEDLSSNSNKISYSKYSKKSSYKSNRSIESRNDNKIIYYPSSKQNGMIFMKKVKND